MNQSSLVFDGRLVIDGNNHTNDSSIFAAGPLTKFKRGYYHDECTHACFNSTEVGKRVGVNHTNKQIFVTLLLVDYSLCFFLFHYEIVVSRSNIRTIRSCSCPTENIIGQACTSSKIRSSKHGLCCSTRFVCDKTFIHGIRLKLNIEQQIVRY
jgi:hypothetical protein